MFQAILDLVIQTTMLVAEHKLLSSFPKVHILYEQWHFVVICAQSMFLQFNVDCCPHQQIILILLAFWCSGEETGE
jgi:hypothetical protein